MPDHAGTMTDARIEELAEKASEKAAEKVIAQVFKRLRIRIDDDESTDAFVDNQRYLTELRLGRKKLAGEVRSTGLDLVKQAVKWLLVAALVAVGANLGMHFGPPSMPALPPIGARP